MTQLRDHSELPSARPASAPETASTRVARLKGEIVYLYAFDIAWELKPITERDLLGQPVGQFVVDASKRAPRQMSFYRPQMVRLPPLDRLGPKGRVTIERTVKFLPVGAISITVRVPFEVDGVEELVAFHDLKFRDGAHLMTPQLEQAIDELARSFDGFYFGRFDIRYSDVDRFRAGEDLCVIELNGITSESTNIYDPTWSLVRAHRTLFRQWSLLFQIGEKNRRRGQVPSPAGALVREIRSHLGKPRQALSA